MYVYNICFVAEQARPGKVSNIIYKYIYIHVNIFK